MDVRDAVCHATCIGEFFYQLFYTFRTLGNLLNQFDVTGRELIGFLCREQGRRENLLDALYVLDKLALVVRGNGDDMIHGHIAQHTCLYLYGLHVGLPFHLVTGFQFLVVHYLRTLEHADALFVKVTLEDDGT